MKLAIIPARGGSKRIPGKNVKSFLGRPIIAYSIEAAIKSGLFDDVVVSTDSDDIGNLACTFGASFPFKRSSKSADDFATTADVLLEVLEMYMHRFTTPTIACCIYPTAPFVSDEKLLQSFDMLRRGNFDSVFPVIQYSYPIQRSLHMEGDKVLMTYPEYINTRSQDLDPRFHDSGQFYWFVVERFLTKKSIMTDNAGAFIVSALEAQDIDTEEDWKLAELKYQLMQERTAK